MFRSLESGKEKRRNPFDKEDFLKDDSWERTDVLGKMLEVRETRDPHNNFFPAGPKRIALEGEIYYDKFSKKIYLGNRNGSWSIVNGLKEIQTNFAGSAFIINSALTGVGTVLGNIEATAEELTNLKHFEAMDFHPKGTYEFNKTVTGITDGKIYVKGTVESVSKLKNVANVAKGLGIGVGVVGFVLSYKDYQDKKISGEILFLDGVMTLLSFTGPGALIAGVYFILIRTDTKDKYFSHKTENIYDSAKMKIDNTRVDSKGYKLIIK
ncbi:hypothetical protein IUY40_02195 [Flavobacterium sp. ALJ2]|uniref:hypothetical protein n=1 Tax=Flavobacterium sp. ALJ2 TaxID=2786960 RepID=UPI00189CB0ED|nr:hypothetical protein [Flavobacterium sp. ALJ2]MBF7090355.1 hypothetical protein [Flavobacterium sp. ALJ2]